VLGRKGFRKLPQHVVEDIYGFRRKAGGRAHGRGGHACPSVVSPEDEAVGIDEEKTLIQHWHSIYRVADKRSILPTDTYAKCRIFATEYVVYLLKIRYLQIGCLIAHHTRNDLRDHHPETG
jgi:hypothetical protein